MLPEEVNIELLFTIHLKCVYILYRKLYNGLSFWLFEHLIHYLFTWWTQLLNKSNVFPTIVSSGSKWIHKHQQDLSLCLFNTLVKQCNYPCSKLSTNCLKFLKSLDSFNSWLNYMRFDAFSGLQYSWLHWHSGCLNLARVLCLLVSDGLQIFLSNWF